MAVVASGDEHRARPVSDKVTLVRVPHGGIQPQTETDGKGVVHLIYFAGEPKAGDIFYARSDDGQRFSKPIRVNSRAGSAIAIGTIRGAHLAVGKGGRVHVAWMGADKAEPRGPSNSAPMLYARLDDEGSAFEPQRNVIQQAHGLDGGGSVAADDAGNVYVMWHAPEPGSRGEGNRCVWVARSTDEGKTFAREVRANADPTGACGCCGMRCHADKRGALFALYRSASEVVHRDMYFLLSTDKGASFRGLRLHPWEVGTCPMSSMSLAETGEDVVAAWETDGQVHCAHVDPRSGKPSPPLAAPGSAKGRKHPVVAADAAGETVLVWTEGTGWNRGGSLSWQVFDKSGRPTESRARVSGVPPWSLAAVFARSDGGFTILY
jgi:hypothetical protein